MRKGALKGLSGYFPFTRRGPSLPNPYLLPGLQSPLPHLHPEGTDWEDGISPTASQPVHWTLSLHRTKVRPLTDKLTHIRKSNTHTHTHTHPSQKSMSCLFRYKEDPQPVSPVPNTKTDGPKANAGGGTKHKEGPSTESVHQASPRAVSSRLHPWSVL